MTTDQSAARADAEKDVAEDPVEAAGETTAASLISGPATEKPVGADTMIEVSGDSPDASSEEKS